MLEERFDQNFTLAFDSQKGVEPVATLDGRKIVIQSVDLQWRADDDRYQGNRNYLKFNFYFEDEVAKEFSGDEDEQARKQSVTIRECLYDTETGSWTFPQNEI